MDFEDFDGEEGLEEGEGGPSFEFSSVDEDMQDLESALRTAKDGLVFAIDCRKNMFIPTTAAGGGTGKTAFSTALAIVSQVMRRKIVVQGKTQCAVLFWGTREKRNENDFDHVFELMSFDLPSAGKIEQMEQYADAGNATLFDKHVGFLQDSKQSCAALDRALWLSQAQFTSNKFTARDEQRIWVFTNDEDLTAHNGGNNSHEQADKQKLITRVGDLTKANTSITLWTLRDKQHGSELAPFWKQILDLKNEEEEEEHVVWLSSDAGLSEVLDLTRRREFAKRALTSVPLVLGPNVEIGVKLYAIVLETKLPYAVPLEERTGKPLKISTRWLCASHAQHLSPDQIITTVQYGPRGAIAFSNEEKKRIKRFAPASIAILGFKPMSELKIWQNVRAPYLVRPDDKAVRNSTKSLAYLVGEVAAQGKFAVARLISNRSAAPKLVALLPQLEEYGGGEVITPLGFLVVVLPFANDIREPYFPDPMERATQDQVDKAKRLIGKLCNARPFDPREYENPALQKFWHNLEALALDQRDNAARVWKEGESDLLRLPNEEDLVFDTEFLDIAEAFTNSYGGGPGEISAPKRKPAAKRKATAEEEDDEAAAPTKKRTAVAGDFDAYDWKQLLSSPDGLQKLKNDELKIYLAHYNLSKSGTKAVLMERIKEHYSEN